MPFSSFDERDKEKKIEKKVKDFCRTLETALG